MEFAIFDKDIILPKQRIRTVVFTSLNDVKVLWSSSFLFKMYQLKTNGSFRSI